MIFPLPEVDMAKPLYLYGAGLMGISYKRQLEQLGVSGLLKGFIEDQPVMESYLSIPVIKRADLTEQQLRSSQFLIASDRLRNIFEANLMRQGCRRENIIHPLGLAWNARSVINGIKSHSKVCVYPVVSNAETLKLIFRKAKIKHAFFAGRGIRLQVTVVVDGRVEFDPVGHPGVNVVKISRQDKYPGAVLEGSDVILIVSAHELANIDVEHHGKVCFYGVNTLEVFARRSKKHLVLNQSRKHKKIINALKVRGRIKVIFLVIHGSVWKMDAVFKKMLVSPLFDPWILVCPYVSYGGERIWEDMRQAFEYFEGKGYPIISAYNEREQRWIGLGEIEPGIVFFTNPHNLTRKEYYQDAYLNYLSCYVPYHHEVGRYGGDGAQYNQGFHNAMWKIYVPHDDSLQTYKRVSMAQGRNVIVSGYPAMEELLEKKAGGSYRDPWKTNDGRCRVIWAPHHTIDDAVLPYSNFLRYAKKFKEFSELRKGEVVWSFKPHPLLKTKLYRHACWGKDETDAYYKYWECQSHTQLNEGEYTNLFLSSDAMIHDSGSFLAEFLYAEKPVMYLLSENNRGEYYNDFGRAALDACEIGYCFDNIVGFVDGLLNLDVRIRRSHEVFLAKEIHPYFQDELPSERIINDIVGNLK